MATYNDGKHSDGSDTVCTPHKRRKRVTSKNKVVIQVYRGMAEVISKPKNVEVIINDLD
jgi:hypothetical protein